jgi:hypothetical protein
MTDPLDLLDGTDSAPAPASPPASHPPRARARRGDPQNSHDAAAAFSVSRLRASQYDIFRLLSLFGPAHDEEIVRRAKLHGVRQKDSGIRTRRSELVRLGVVRDSGRHVILSDSQEKSTIWEVNRDSGRHVILSDSQEKSTIWEVNPNFRPTPSALNSAE